MIKGDRTWCSKLSTYLDPTINFQDIWKITYNRLEVTNFESNDICGDEQHGFRKYKSTVTALVNFTEPVIESLDNKDKAAGIVCW